MTDLLENLHTLDPGDYSKVAHLSGIPDFHLCCRAVLMGMNPGLIIVDDPDIPHSAFISTAEGCYLIGEADNDTFIQAINQELLTGSLTGGEVSMLLASPAWQARVDDLFTPRTPVSIARRHYICREAAAGTDIPERFTVRHIDAALLSDPDVLRPDHIARWIRSNWGSLEAFRERGFGAVTIDEEHNKVVSWSLADCTTGNRAEIGIRTDPDYRQRGLAALTAAECVKLGLSQGLKEIGWQCSESNLGSIRTAERAGFTLERHYVLHDLILDKAEHDRFVAWLAEHQ